MIHAKGNRRSSVFYVALSLVILIHSFPAPLLAQVKRIKLAGKTTTVQKLLKEVSRQTGLVVYYSDAILDGTQKISIPANTWNLTDLLNLVVADRYLSYEINDRSIVFAKTLERQAKIETALNTKGPIVTTHALSGKVLDENNSDLPGVSVSLVGRPGGTVTDEKGAFYFSAVGDSDLLQLSAVSIETFQVRVAGRTNIVLKTRARISELQEVIVNKGYYTEKKKLSVGNTVAISSKEVDLRNVTNPLQSLAGRVAGLMITPNAGVAGTGFEVLIRGRGSLLNGNDPLYIVDGVPYPSQLEGFKNTMATRINGANYTPSPLYFLSPQDIVSIDVLKDADACSIYGARGANGVILISTTKARENRFRLNINISGGIARVAHVTPKLNAQQYLNYRKETFEGDMRQPGPLDYDLNGAWSDAVEHNWDKVLRGKTAMVQNTHISAAGGTDIFRYLISGSYSRESNVTPGNFGATILRLHSNMEISSSNKRLTINYGGDIVSSTNRFTQNITSESRYYPLSPPLYTSDNKLNWQNNTFLNPLMWLRLGMKLSMTNVLSNVTVQYIINSDLRFKMLAGFNNMKLDDLMTTPVSFFRPSLNMLYGSASFGFNKLFSGNIEPQLLYTHAFGRMKLASTIGYSYMRSSIEGYSLNGYGYTADADLESIGAAPMITKVENVQTDYRYNAIFGRLNLNWQDTYLVNMTVRRDGSSRFGNTNKFAGFWSAAAGWIFASPARSLLIPGLSYGKLRVSYGLTGNDLVGDYRYQRTFNYLNYQVPYQGIQSLTPSELLNPNLSWEKTRKTEIGLDLSFAKDRLQMSASYFIHHSTAQLVTLSIPSFTGFPSVPGNINALVSNKGWEFTFAYRSRSTSPLIWNSSFNLSIARNRLEDYPNIAGSPYNAFYKLGQTINLTPVLEYVGVSPQTGLYTFRNANGEITSQPDPAKDKTRFVSFDPAWYGGFSNTLRYKKWELDIFLQFVKQVKEDPLFTNPKQPGYFAHEISLNWPVEILKDRWQKPGDVATIQRFSTDFSAQMAYYYASISNRAFTDASFLRVKSVCLSYVFEKKSLAKFHIENVRCYFEAQNLWTLTGYKGNDPEVPADFTPPLQKLIAGIQIGL